MMKSWTAPGLFSALWIEYRWVVIVELLMALAIQNFSLLIIFMLLHPVIDNKAEKWFTEMEHYWAALLILRLPTSS